MPNVTMDVTTVLCGEEIPGWDGRDIVWVVAVVLSIIYIVCWAFFLLANFYNCCCNPPTAADCDALIACISSYPAVVVYHIILLSLWAVLIARDRYELQCELGGKAVTWDYYCMFLVWGILQFLRLCGRVCWNWGAEDPTDLAEMSWLEVLTAPIAAQVRTPNTSKLTPVVLHDCA